MSEPTTGVVIHTRDDGCTDTVAVEVRDGRIQIYIMVEDGSKHTMRTENYVVDRSQRPGKVTASPRVGRPRRDKDLRTRVQEKVREKYDAD